MAGIAHLAANGMSDLQPAFTMKTMAIAKDCLRLSTFFK